LEAAEVSVSVTVVVVAACIGIYCLWAKMIKPKPVNEPQLGTTVCSKSCIELCETVN